MWQMTPVTGEGPAGADVLRWPLVGRLLKHRHARTFLQVGLLFAAGVLVLHGLVGPQVAPGNLSTVLTWVHYRGLLVMALVAVGNRLAADLNLWCSDVYSWSALQLRLWCCSVALPA